MNVRQPSRAALALFDYALADDDPLRGDLLEEFEARQSQVWLWRQVLGAIVSRWRQSWTFDADGLALTLAGAGLLVLISFEVVFVANSASRLLFGPPAQVIQGYAYLMSRATPSPATSSIPLVAWVVPSLLALAVALPVGWATARVDGHRLVPTAIVTTLVLLWTIANIQAPFVVQFASMLALLVGFLAGSRVGGIGRTAGAT